MKQLVILCGHDCAYCKKAKMLLKRALEKEPKYLALDIRFVMEDSEDGQPYSHTLVPAFFCGNLRCFEGNPSMDDVLAALKNCYE